MSENRTRYVLFDLDGTLTDSGPGIIHSVVHAFQKLNLPVPDQAALRTFVGPPLRGSFARYGVPQDEVEQAVLYYREVYNDTGLFENAPYPGIIDLLEKLRAEGNLLYVATSKPEEMARRVLQHFDMSRYFEIICGGTPDETRVNKSDVIEYLLDKIRSRMRQEPGSLVMVGDTVYDVIGAREKDIPCIGVTWGYGSLEDMKKEGALCIVSTMEELYDAIETERPEE